MEAVTSAKDRRGRENRAADRAPSVQAKDDSLTETRTVAVGKTVYSRGADPCSGMDNVWSEVEFDAALERRVADLAFDA